MCSLVANDKIQPSYEYDESSIGDRSIPKDATTKELKSLGDTINCIDIWLRLCDNNFDDRCVAYITAMKDMFNNIPQTMFKRLTPKKVQKPMTGIGGGW